MRRAHWREREGKHVTMENGGVDCCNNNTSSSESTKKVNLKVWLLQNQYQQ